MKFAMIRNLLRKLSPALVAACTFNCLAGFTSAPLSAQQPPASQPAQQAAPQPAQPPAANPPAGQQPSQAPANSDDSNFKIVTSVNEVNLIFTVTDKHGNFIPNLKQSDFALLDDQKAPARISSFTQQTNLP